MLDGISENRMYVYIYNIYIIYIVYIIYINNIYIDNIYIIMYIYIHIYIYVYCQLRYPYYFPLSGDFHTHGGTPIAGWFMMENPQQE